MAATADSSIVPTKWIVICLACSIKMLTLVAVLDLGSDDTAFSFFLSPLLGNMSLLAWQKTG
jgi:hypothetical protein